MQAKLDVFSDIAIPPAPTNMPPVFCTIASPNGVGAHSRPYIIHRALCVVAGTLSHWRDSRLRQRRTPCDTPSNPAWSARSYAGHLLLSILIKETCGGPRHTAEYRGDQGMRELDAARRWGIWRLQGREAVTTRQPETTADGTEARCGLLGWRR
ncbi:hypothetical protein BJ912DRAFT_119917 [Pholiota molesta]|nr:hypothetical protein BJ912DRAFT_119917 [Pholiota molesta]